MTKQFLILLCVTLVCASVSNSQQLEDSKSFKFQNPNSVQLEAFGSGIFYSAIYERFFINEGRFKTNVNLGLAYYGEKANVRATHLVNVGINEVFSISPNHHLELGASVIGYKENLSEIPELFRQEEEEYSTLFSARVGYRYQRPNGKFLLRVAVTPIYEGGAAIYDSSSIHPWPALAMGYSF